MKEIIPLDSRYVPLTQQQYCCVPTCIQMVMLKHNIPLVPAELLGHELGLIVPEGEKTTLWNPRTGKTSPPAGFGTQVGENEGQYNPNDAFKKLRIPLKMTFKYIDAFKNIEEYKNYLQKVIEKDKDVIICFDYGTFAEKADSHWGHVCLLDTVDFEANSIRVIDPGYYEKKWEFVPIEKLFKAMKAHGKEKGGGFWELEEING